MTFDPIERAENVGQKLIDVCKAEKLKLQEAIFVLGVVYSELCHHAKLASEEFKDICDTLSNDYAKRYKK